MKKWDSKKARTTIILYELIVQGLPTWLTAATAVNRNDHWSSEACCVSTIVSFRNLISGRKYRVDSEHCASYDWTKIFFLGRYRQTTGCCGYTLSVDGGRTRNDGLMTRETTPRKHAFVYDFNQSRYIIISGGDLTRAPAKGGSEQPRWLHRCRRTP